MGTDASPGLIIQLTLAISWTTTSKARASTTGQTAESTKVTGGTIKWKEKVSFNGRTAESTRENTSTIKKKARGPFTGKLQFESSPLFHNGKYLLSLGLMEGNTRASGSMVNNTVSEPIPLGPVKPRWVNGEKASGPRGSDTRSRLPS